MIIWQKQKDSLCVLVISKHGWLSQRGAFVEPDIVDFVLNVQSDKNAFEYAQRLGMLPKPTAQQNQALTAQQGRKRGKVMRCASSHEPHDEI